MPSRIWHATITGTVRGPSGALVNGADVQITPVFLEQVSNSVKVGRCTGEAGSSLSARTASNGRFVITWTGDAIPAFVCLLATGTATIDGKLATGITEVDSITLGPTGLDSLEVPISLKAP